VAVAEIGRSTGIESGGAKNVDTESVAQKSHVLTKHAKRSLPYFQDFTSEWRSFRGAATWKKTALSVLQFKFHYFTTLPFQSI